ncbi:MAG TPA: DUF6036 family nucleotidyltransferase [Thermoanaerobaculia bacterium]
MRRLTDRERLQRFMRRLGRESKTEARVYLTGGASAVLHDWRATTVDVDLRIEPDNGEVLRAIPGIKEELEINVELASPGDFIPELPGWRDRSPFISREGQLSFHHYDFHAQALSKIERGHERDIRDVEAMLERELVTTPGLLRYFAVIEPELYRYPAITPAVFRTALEAFIAGHA